MTEAVHAQSGTIYLQLWHVGRISHPSLQPEGVLPVAPSAVKPKAARTFIENGTFVEVGIPRELTVIEIKGIINDYRIAARNAIQAGFDGVEIHGANGYLLNQFLCDGSNLREDIYGGSVQNRLRFPLEVVAAVVSEIGAGRTGIRLSPISPANGVFDSSPATVFFPLVRELNQLKIVYIHVIEGATGGSRDSQDFDFQALRKEFSGTWIVNNGYTREMAIEVITSGYADLVAFGKPYVANPDLVERFKQNAPLNQPDASTFYGGDAKGYTDYPRLNESSG